MLLRLAALAATAAVCVLMLLLAAGTAQAQTAGKRSEIAKRLNRGLAGTPMAGLGYILERNGRQFGISPYLIAAIAAKESSLGAASCRNNPKNVFGLSSCGSGWYVPYFETWNEAIHFEARFLKTRWPGAASPYDFHGYAECLACWASSVASHMSRIWGVPPTPATDRHVK